jgi:hypothetical protein
MSEFDHTEEDGLILETFRQIACGVIPVTDGVRSYLLDWAQDAEGTWSEWAASLRILAGSSAELIRCFFGGKYLAIGCKQSDPGKHLQDFYSNDLVAVTGLPTDVVEAACFEFKRLNLTDMDPHKV